MIDMEEVTSDTERVLYRLDADILPETYSYMSSLLEDGPVSADLCEMADTLSELDKPQEFPDFLADFIRKMYDLEIAEGNDDAMNSVGAQYYTGSRVYEQDFEKAVAYYKMAVEKGNRTAAENLGYCYYYGRDGEPDYEKAFHCFALGAFAGELVSLYKIGDMYLNGLYVEKNEREAFDIYSRCQQAMTSDDGDRIAGPVYLRLGRMYLDGTGTERNSRLALMCFQFAEQFLYRMVVDGDSMYLRSLQSAIDGQEEARKRLMQGLPDNRWGF